MKHTLKPIIAATLICMFGCASPDEKLYTAVSGRNTPEIERLLSDGKCYPVSIQNALSLAVKKRNTTAAETILKHLKATGNLATIKKIPENYVVEYDEPFSVQHGNNYAYCKTVKRPAPSLISVAISNHDEATARLLLSCGMPCNYQYYIDTSGSYPDGAEKSMAILPGVDLEIRQNINGKMYLWKWNHLVTPNVPENKKPGAFYVVGNDAQAARKFGLNKLADDIENISKSRNR